MKTIFTLTILLLIGSFSAIAQRTEMEPNDSIPQANALPLDTVMSGSICFTGPSIADFDFFRIVLPADGAIRMYTFGIITRH